MEAAEGIIRIVNESMFGALRLVSVEQGYDPRDFSLVGFGGAGPLHANALGILTGSWPVIIPPGPGVLCAYGDATTQVQDEAARTYITMAEDTSSENLLDDLRSLRLRASESLSADGIREQDLEAFYQADLRYTGQAYQITLDFTEQELENGGILSLTRRFDAEHKHLFTFDLGEGHEIVMIRAIVRVRQRAIAELETSGMTTRLEDCKVHDTRYYYDGNWHDAVVYAREKLHEGLTVPGPAVISEMDSTTLVLPGYQAGVDALGNLVINPA